MIKRTQFRFKETNATIICEERYLEIAKTEIRKQRSDLERYILRDPFFQLTFEPYECPSNAPELAKRMAAAAAKAGVGPMAAVAGAIAECAVEAMVEAGAEHAIVDNGGDIAMYLDRPVTVGIYAGESLKTLGIRVEPRGSIVGICTSSGTIGHSISFGIADAVTVISNDVALADAAATALCNKITKDEKELIDRAINSFKMDGLDGIIVITHNHIGTRGHIPQIIKTDVNYDLITKW